MLTHEDTKSCQCLRLSKVFYKLRFFADVKSHILLLYTLNHNCTGLMFTLANSIAVSMYIIGFAESLLDMLQVKLYVHCTCIVIPIQFCLYIKFGID